MKKLILKHRHYLVLALDCFIVAFFYWLCLFNIDQAKLDCTIVVAFTTLVTCVSFFALVLASCGFHKSLWKYAQLGDFIRLVCTVVICGVIVCAYTFILLRQFNWLGSVLFIMLSSFFLCAYRVIYTSFRGTFITDKASSKHTKRVLIVGAGRVASVLISDLLANPYMNALPVCAIDDDPLKLDKYINQVRVVGNISNVCDVVKEFDIDEIYIAIKYLSSEDKRRIIEACVETKLPIKTVPNHTVMDQRGVANSIRPINVEDLLGRDVQKFDNKEVNAFLKDKVALVTGGGGSIGSELCRQIAMAKPKQLIILDISENSAYRIQQELKNEYGDKLNMVVEIASIREADKLDYIFGKYTPDILFHAAAHKHVPLMEHNPEEAIKNNVFGTKNTLEMARKHGIKKVVMISTDKAVNPTNFMGATKRMTEKILQSMKGTSDTEFVAVRFGNVLGSAGSVIPLFKAQIEKGGPVTVTHEKMTRYFMTIPEAVSLVLQTALIAKGGEIFVLDMGKPMSILKLAENVIKLSGYTPYRDIDIKITGLRPGEKLYEELLMNEEGTLKTENEKIFIGIQPSVTEQEVKEKLDILEAVVNTNDKKKILMAMAQCIETYSPDTSEF
ncbi:MAG: polysaccharide biosynthesis protein [Oscillospiraceae bacterium]|nr:polysaccharide biosynthesis protein [Oscillospiraceae bacterium]